MKQTSFETSCEVFQIFFNKSKLIRWPFSDRTRAEAFNAEGNRFGEKPSGRVGATVQSSSSLLVSLIIKLFSNKSTNKPTRNHFICYILIMNSFMLISFNVV